MHKDEPAVKEQLDVESATVLLEACGFRTATAVMHRGMKFIDAEYVDECPIRFWVKQGWAYKPNCTAVQFSGIEGRKAKEIPDEEFLRRVRRSVDGAIRAGATYALFVQPGENRLWNWLVLPIEDVYNSYADQLGGWPRRARNGAIPTLYFVDERALEAARCVEVVRSRAVNLESLALHKRVSISSV